MIREIEPALKMRKIADKLIGRREVLKKGCCAAGVVAASRLFGRFGIAQALAQPLGDYKALVCVFLYGGNDANNTVIPLDKQGYAQYARIRGPLALPEGALLPIAPPSVAGPLGLHPALGSLQSLFDSKKLAILANVGTLSKPITKTDVLASSPSVPSNLFSHLDQQNQWQSCVTDSSSVTSGWGGRLAAVFRQQSDAGTVPMAISLAGNSLFCQGKGEPGLAMQAGFPLTFGNLVGDQGAGERYAAMQQMLTFGSGFSLIQAASQNLSVAFKESTLLGGLLSSTPPLQTKFPATVIGSQLQGIANCLQVRGGLGASRNVFFAIQGGFDTHGGQLGAQLSALTQLDQALQAFYDATVELGVQNQIVTFTMSDFSRTLMPTLDGSDHAWGGHHFIIGGAVQGGDLYGTLPELSLGSPDDATSEGRWIPTTSVDQYAATLANWFGVPAGQLQSVAPDINNFSRQTLGFL